MPNTTNHVAQRIPEAKGRKFLEKTRSAKSSLSAQNLQPAKQKKPEAGAHNSVLSMCIIFSVGKLK